MSTLHDPSEQLHGPSWLWMPCPYVEKGYMQCLSWLKCKVVQMNYTGTSCTYIANRVLWTGSPHLFDHLFCSGECAWQALGGIFGVSS